MSTRIDPVTAAAIIIGLVMCTGLMTFAGWAAASLAEPLPAVLGSGLGCAGIGLAVRALAGRPPTP